MTDDYSTGFKAGIAYERHRILVLLLGKDEDDQPLLDLIKCNNEGKWLNGRGLRDLIEGQNWIE